MGPYVVRHVQDNVYLLVIANKRIKILKRRGVDFRVQVDMEIDEHKEEGITHEE